MTTMLVRSSRFIRLRTSKLPPSASSSSTAAAIRTLSSTSRPCSDKFLRSATTGRSPADKKDDVKYSKTSSNSGASLPSKSSSRSFSTSTSSPPFDKILVANRGEIVERVLRTCHRLGIDTVAVTSTVDARAPYAQLAGESVCLGGPAAHESYLNVNRILEALDYTGAQAVHPGYGFLSENADAAQQIMDAGYAWLGPPPDVIRIMGDKLRSKQAALQAGMQTVPGTDLPLESLEQALALMNDDDSDAATTRMQYPVLLKALAGGGGKGMRICRSDKELKDAWEVSRAEARQFFGNADLLLEKYIDRPHHIEFQVLCGSNNGNEIVIFPERECSIQRRNQKIIEESPSVLLTEETRQRMASQVKLLCEQTGYQSAGTVEFLVDEDERVYFLEMNSRLQVEHPVSEEITGVDLVEGMIYVGAGWDLPDAFRSNNQESIILPHSGHAVEARIYAEDPTRGFVPSTGALTPYVEPFSSMQGDFGSNNNMMRTRVDSGVRAGQHVTAHYDPMLSKVVAYGPTRDLAMNRLGQALDEYVICGVQHNARLVSSILRHEAFIQGHTPTTFLDLHYPDMATQLTDLSEQLTESECQELAVVAAILQEGGKSKSTEQAASSSVVRLEGLFGPAYLCDLTASTSNDNARTARIRLLADDGANFDDDTTTITATTCTIRITDFRSIPDRHCVEVTLNDVPRTVQVLPTSKAWNYNHSRTRSSDALCLQMYGAQTSQTLVQSRREYELSKHMQPPPVDHGQHIMVRSPMPGTLVSYSVQPGDIVQVGQELCIVEAMKMQNQVTSPRAGVIRECAVEVGASLQVDQVLIEFEGDDTESGSDEAAAIA